MTKKVKARQDQKKKKKKSLGPLHTVGCKVYHRIFHIFRFLYLKLTISFSVSIILSTTFKDISERSLHCRLTIHCHVKTFLELINWKMLRLSQGQEQKIHEYIQQIFTFILRTFPKLQCIASLLKQGFIYCVRLNSENLMNWPQMVFWLERLTKIWNRKLAQQTRLPANFKAQPCVCYSTEQAPH